MNSEQISAFLAAVQTGSFSKAADFLYITQPTLTHRIQSLEKELDVQLFDRRKGQRTVELTEKGKAFFPIARRWEDLLLDNNRLLEGTVAPTFSVAANQTLSTYVMPEVYSRFLSRKLPVNLSLHTLHFHECYYQVESRQVDAVFVSKAMASPTVSTFPVLTEKMVLLCRRGAPYGEGMRPSQLDQNLCTYLRWSYEFESWYDYHFSSIGHAIFADSMKLTERILSTSDRWAIVPISAAAVATRNTDLVYYNLEDAPPDRPIYLLTLEPQHKYTQLLVEDLKSTMLELMNT